MNNGAPVSIVTPVSGLMHDVTEQGVMHVTTHGGGELVPFDLPGPLVPLKTSGEEVVMASSHFYFRGPASDASMALAAALASTLIDREAEAQGWKGLMSRGKHRRGLRG